MNLLPLKTKKKSFNSSQRFFRAFHILIYNKITSLTLELKILSLRHKGIFVFSLFWGVIVGFVKGDNIIYHLIIIIFVEKVVVACFQWVGGAVHFGWCVRRLLTVKNMLSPRHFILCHVLFLGGSCHFFPFILSPALKTLNPSLIFVGVLQFILLVLIFLILVIFSFIKVLFVFNLVI